MTGGSVSLLRLGRLHYLHIVVLLFVWTFLIIMFTATEPTWSAWWWMLTTKRRVVIFIFVRLLITLIICITIVGYRFTFIFLRLKFIITLRLAHIP